MNAIKVLDYGFVRLVSYMQPVPGTAPDNWTGDLEIVRNARVSYAAAWRTGEDTGKDAKLLSYLMKNRHTTPLEAMVFTFEVKAPIFVLRQWHRHRTWSYNELSARYRELPDDFYVPEIENVTTQSTSNKQMRTDEVNPNAQAIHDQILRRSLDNFSLYKRLLEAECPRELARLVLPLNVYSHMFATVDLHNYAKALLQAIEPVVPVASKEFKERLENTTD